MAINYSDEDRQVVKEIEASETIFRGLSDIVDMSNLIGGPVMRRERNVTTLLNTYFNALHTELGELANELPTKPWNPDKPYSEKAACMELADVFAMLGNIIWIMIMRLGIPLHRIIAAYHEKMLINMDRISQQNQD
jgi:hypothetical protein